MRSCSVGKGDLTLNQGTTLVRLQPPQQKYRWILNQIIQCGGATIALFLGVEIVSAGIVNRTRKWLLVYFDELNNLIPFAPKGEKHSTVTVCYPGVVVKGPGKYGPSDFVVEVTDDAIGWKDKQFTHVDLFNDIQVKTNTDSDFMQDKFAEQLAGTIMGNYDPDSDFNPCADVTLVPHLGLRYSTLLQCSQALAVAEHRRYARYEANGGGRFLPARFAIGIIYKYWTAEDAAAVQKSGMPGLKMLLKAKGHPPTMAYLGGKNDNPG